MVVGMKLSWNVLYFVLKWWIDDELRMMEFELNFVMKMKIGYPINCTGIYFGLVDDALCVPVFLLRFIRWCAMCVNTFASIYSIMHYVC